MPIQPKFTPPKLLFGGFFGGLVSLTICHVFHVFNPPEMNSLISRLPQNVFYFRVSYSHAVIFFYNRAISKLLGERWRELSEEKREEFARSAKEMADERMKVNPDCWKRKHKKDKEPGQPGMPGLSCQSGMNPFKAEHNNNSLNGSDCSIINNNNNNEEDYEGQSDSKRIK